jgi:hypothetical protein
VQIGQTKTIQSLGYKVEERLRIAVSHTVPGITGRDADGGTIRAPDRAECTDDFNWKDPVAVALLPDPL